ncbi:MAG TPA: tetratricopeptide repeat protein [Verrucomicrobiales bacterium]|nr:tetratricopeptide repeat protein [Verrucomicrobiales bacterium]
MAFRANRRALCALLLLTWGSGPATASSLRAGPEPPLPPAEQPGPEADREAKVRELGEALQSPAERALQIYREGDVAAALERLEAVLAADPEDFDARALRASIFDRQGAYQRAKDDFDVCLKLRPDSADLRHYRGVARFMLGDFAGSVADFNAYLEAFPGRRAAHWQRGIALYCNGDYAAGRRQFEEHQTVNPRDVENAAWHYLCVARQENVEQAHRKLIPIEGDPRVPMTEIHRLYAGTGTEKDVLAACEAGEPDPAELRDRLGYAHLYIGLYEEAQGRNASALAHLKLAAEDYFVPHYMGRAAQVYYRHRARLGAQNIP